MSSYTEGQVHQLANALEGAGFTPDDVTKLGQNKDLGGIRGVLRGTHEIRKVARSWCEKDEIIYFSVASDGTEGEDWIKRLEGSGSIIGDRAKQVLRSPSFKPTKGVVTGVAVLLGCLFKDDDRITKKIRADAEKRNLVAPNAEVACLIHEKFGDLEMEAMGPWSIVVMHEPINDSVGDPLLLGAFRCNGGHRLYAYDGGPGLGWHRDYGFAFVVSPSLR